MEGGCGKEVIGERPQSLNREDWRRGVELEAERRLGDRYLLFRSKQALCVCGGGGVAVWSHHVIDQGCCLAHLLFR